MDVGVPACGQRQSPFLCQHGTQHAHLAGACDVNQVRLEAVKHFADDRNVAQKPRIEAQVFLESKGEKAARQLQGSHIAVFQHGLVAVAGAHAEKGQIAAACEGLEVTAGVGHSVYFVEGIGEIGYARRVCAGRFVENRIEGFCQHMDLNVTSAHQSCATDSREEEQEQLQVLRLR